MVTLAKIILPKLKLLLKLWNQEELEAISIVLRILAVIKAVFLKVLHFLLD